MPIICFVGMSMILLELSICPREMYGKDGRNAYRGF